MREILFRGKRLDNGEWIEGSLLKVTIENQTFHLIFGDSFAFDGKAVAAMSHCCVDPDTVGQYTGLTDIIGQRNFEGDIVSILPDDGEIGVIEWADDEAMFMLEADGWCANFDNYFSTELEVIGNIHDNPELLKGEHK